MAPFSSIWYLPRCSFPS